MKGRQEGESQRKKTDLGNRDKSQRSENAGPLDLRREERATELSNAIGF